MEASSKPIAVHLHLYYTDMWMELKEQLLNLGQTPYDLFVTLVEENPSLEKEIKQFHPTADVWTVKNMGYDIGPFIEFLNKINLDNYDYILKLHSKRLLNKPQNELNRLQTVKYLWKDILSEIFNGTYIKLNHFPIIRYWWKILLSEALIGSSDIWKKNLQAFTQNPKLGMIASPYLIKKADKTDASMLPTIKEQLQRLNLPQINSFSFVAGTMFLVRSSLFKILQNHYTVEDFAVTDGQIKDGTLAHIMERLFGAIINAQGYTINGFSHNRKFVCSALSINILKFFYQKKITSKNKMLIKIMKIPVFQKNYQKNEPF